MGSKADRSASVLVLALLLGTHCEAAPPDPEEPILEGVVQGEGRAKAAIAVPTASSDLPSSTVAATLVEVVRADLDFSGYFEIVDPSLYGKVPRRTDGTIDHEGWLAVGAESLVQLEVRGVGPRTEVVSRVFDNPSGTRRFAYRYSEDPKRIRRLAHQVADDIVRQFTGREGIGSSRIAYVATSGKGKELFVMDYDGERAQKLSTTASVNVSPAWAPDSSRLAFVSWKDGRPGLYVLGAEGHPYRPKTVGGNLQDSPAWSSDGRRLLYTSDASGNPDLYILDLESGSSTRVTRTASIETSGSFGVGDRQIVFVSDRSGSPQIYVAGADGLGAERVSREEYAVSPAWSPEGDRIAYSARLDGRLEIVVLDLHDRSTRRLTHEAGNNEDPAWSPDGRHLVFSSNRSGTYDLYVVGLDGKNPKRLTRGAGAMTPSWSR